MKKKYGIHGCGWLSFDKVCRQYGCPRIHLVTPTHNIGIAVTRDARFANSTLVDGKVVTAHPPAQWVRVVRHPQ